MRSNAHSQHAAVQFNLKLSRMVRPATTRHGSCSLWADDGRLMQEAADAKAGGMVAVIGGDEAAVRKLCQDAAGAEVLVPANFNAPGQIVISGDKTACDRAIRPDNPPTESAHCSPSSASSTQSMEGVLMFSPTKIPAISLPPFVIWKILGSGRSGV